MTGDSYRRYPIAIIQDRYGGTYSGGLWLAVASCTDMDNGSYLIVRMIEDVPHGSDTETMIFWQSPPDWIAVGNTPNEALAALKARSL